MSIVINIDVNIDSNTDSKVVGRISNDAFNAHVAPLWSRVGYELVLHVRSKWGKEQFERFWREGGSLPNPLDPSVIVSVNGSETLTF